MGIPDSTGIDPTDNNQEGSIFAANYYVSYFDSIYLDYGIYVLFCGREADIAVGRREKGQEINL